MQSVSRVTKAEIPTGLPDGCRLHALKTIADHRGDFTELFCNVWFDSPAPLQWNMSHSHANVMRGVHVHAKHWDYVAALSGRMIIGLSDMRRTSRTRLASALVELDAAVPMVLSIPPGVAHGFYFPVAAFNVTGASRYYDPPDHMRCRWDCPELALAWPCDAPQLSPVDQAAGSYAEFEAQLAGALAAAQA